MSSATKVFAMLVVVAVVFVTLAYAIDRPKLPRGIPCKSCYGVRAVYGAGLGGSMIYPSADDHSSFGSAGRNGAELVPRDLADNNLDEVYRLDRQGRSPYWPLKHPALDTRKRHRQDMFLHPNVRSYVMSYLEPMGSGPFVDESAMEDPKTLADNRLKDVSSDERKEVLTAGMMIEKLKEKLRAAVNKERLRKGDISAAEDGNMLGRVGYYGGFRK